MNKIYYFLISCLSLLALASCDHTETYAEQKEAERDAINAYITKAGIKVISQAQFEANGCKTNVADNEFVLFSNTGVYMQIIHEGVGKKLGKGQRADVACRFTEWNLKKQDPVAHPDSFQLSNNVAYFISQPDIMAVSNNSGTFTASFTAGVMMSSKYGYGSASVPGGWLVPLTYIKLGKPNSEDDEIAHVRLIVPSSQGQQYASSAVYPCLYDITYQLGVQ